MLNLNQPLRILQTVLALITLGLNGYGKSPPPVLRPN